MKNTPDPDGLPGTVYENIPDPDGLPGTVYENTPGPDGLPIPRRAAAIMRWRAVADPRPGVMNKGCIQVSIAQGNPQRLGVLRRKTRRSPTKGRDHAS